MKLELTNEASTLALGGALAQCVKPGMRVYLSGELGAGKTTLVRGLLRALGHEGAVKSPSYALVEPYVISGLNLYHFDFYRFVESREFADAGLQEYFDDRNVCLVEWPEKVAGLPKPDLAIALTMEAQGRSAGVIAATANGNQCIAGLQPGF